MRAASAEDWREKARRAEAVGYSVMLMPDHFMWDLSVFPALQAAADATKTLRVGSMVLCNDFRHPLVTARDAASLQMLSGGRFELGIGAGWVPDEYAQVGIGFDPPAVRIDRLGEALAIMRRAFSGEKLDFEGRFYRISGYEGRPKADPRPPFVLGGGGRKMLGLAGREADVVSITYNLKSGMDKDAERFDEARLGEKVGWVREAAGARFGDIELGLMAFWAGVTDDPLSAVKSAAESMGCTAEEALEMPSFFYGSEAAIEEKLEGLRERFGISYFIFSEFASDLASLEELVGRLRR
jgi:probable F420-dependent oxidoreductase